MTLSSAASLSRGTSPLGSSPRSSSAVMASTVFTRIVEEMMAEEASLRRRLASRKALDADPVSPFDLLRFTRSCLEAASTLLRGPTEPSLDAVDAAHRMVCRVETLLRCKLNSRRCYSSSDWLNLCRDFMRGEHSEEDLIAVESERLAQLQHALEEESRLCAARGAPKDAVCAFQEAIACAATRPTESSDLYGLLENGGTAMHTPERMAQWLALRDRAAPALSSSEGDEIDEGDVAFSLHLATEAATAIQSELESVCGACSRYFAYAPLPERQRLFGLRAHFGRLLVAVLLYQCNASVALLRHHQGVVRRRQSDMLKGHRSRSAQPSYGNAATSAAATLPLLEWTAHHITVRYAQVVDLAKRELLDDEPLLAEVETALERWSAWLTTQSRAVGNPEAAATTEELHMPFPERWKFQLQRSRQYAASHPLLLDDTHPALEYLVQRCPGSVALPLLLMRGGSPNTMYDATPVAEARLLPREQGRPAQTPSGDAPMPQADVPFHPISDVAVVWHSSESASTRSASTTAGAIVPLPAVSSPKPMEPPLPIAGLRSRDVAVLPAPSAVVVGDTSTAIVANHLSYLYDDDGRASGSSALAAFKKRAFDALGKFVLHPLPPGRDPQPSRESDSPVPEQHLHSPTPVPPPPSVKPLQHYATTAISSSASLGGGAAPFTDSSASPGARDPRSALSTSRSATGTSSERNFFPILEPAMTSGTSVVTLRRASALMLSEPARALDAQDVPKPAALVPRPARTLLLPDQGRARAVVADPPPLLFSRHR